MQGLVVQTLLEGTQGDFMECGAYKGGVTIFWASIMKAYGVSRTVWVADSFAGLPDMSYMKREVGDATQANHKGVKDQEHWVGLLEYNEDQVRQNFRNFGLLGSNIKFLKGFFNDTLPTAPVTKLAFLRLDSDIYVSIYESLEFMYPKVSKGGYVLFDDWKLDYARQAVEDYRRKHEITAEIKFLKGTIDPMAYWRK